jgi:hypothetical protein
VRISENFGIDRSQGELDFIDVDLESDTRAYVEPRAIRRIPSEWAEGCVGLLQDFFENVLAAVRDGDRNRGLDLLEGLREPNETHLGLSSGRPRGTGLGPGLVDRVWNRLCQSEAAKSGLLEERCRDTALDERGFVLVLDDSDLGELAEARIYDEAHETRKVFDYMADRFSEIV